VFRPDQFALFAWQAGWVFGLRSLDLAVSPLEAPAAMAAHVLEKQKAFAEGAVRATIAMMEGARPDVVAAAALAPSRKRVAANIRALRRRV
jgi:hypothetical protein